MAKEEEEEEEEAEEGCVAVWEGLSEGACPSLIALHMEDVGMNDDGIRCGLARAIRKRRTERGGEGGVCPCLTTLEVLRLTRPHLTYLAPLCLTGKHPNIRGFNGMVFEEGEGFVEREGARGRWSIPESEGGALAALPSLEVLSLKYCDLEGMAYQCLHACLEVDDDWVSTGWKSAGFKRENMRRTRRIGNRGDERKIGKEEGREEGEEAGTASEAVPAVGKEGRRNIWRKRRRKGTRRGRSRCGRSWRRLRGTSG
jgi:hypothetical protein